MIGKSKRAAAGALAAMAIMFTASLFAASSANAAQSATATGTPSLAKTIIRHSCDPVVIVDRAPC